MKRYPHFIAPVKRGTFPRLVEFVAVRTEQEQVSGKSGVVCERLVEWKALTLKGSEGKYGRAKLWQGYDCQSFWSGIQDCTTRSTTIYTIASKMLRTLSLLMVWDKIQDGTITLQASASHGTKKKRETFTNPAIDPAILQDPPTVIRLRLLQSRCQIVAVDLANYGIGDNELPTDPEAALGAMATWFRDACGELVARRMGGWNATAGGQSWHTWRYKHLKHTVYAHVCGSALKLERKAYYGGRCECFHIGEVDGPLWHLDFRSLYPYCCKSQHLPCRLAWTQEGNRAAYTYARCVDKVAIADVTVITDRPYYPLREGGMTCWPVGRFRTVLCGPELDWAIAHHNVSEWHQLALYETDPILSSAEEEWLSIRSSAELTNNRLLASWAKRCAVCLPGKFGQRGMGWVDVPGWMNDRPWEQWHMPNGKGELVRYRCLNWRVQREQSEYHSPDAIPSVAAWVTSLARVRLLQAIEAAGWERVMYCDTDSLIVDQVGLDRLNQAGWYRQGQWGYLQPKGTHTYGGFYGVKHYHLDGELTCSGMPAGEVVGGKGPGFFWYDMSVQSYLRSGRTPEATARLQQFARHAGYKLGTVGANGRVHPLTRGV